jgi:hypothetical protein
VACSLDEQRVSGVAFSCPVLRPHAMVMMQSLRWRPTPLGQACEEMPRKSAPI